MDTKEGRDRLHNAQPMTTEVKNIRAAVQARDEASKAEVPVGSVPRQQRNNARPARGWDPLEQAGNRILCLSLRT